MSISENKIELVKLLLETEDLYILDQIKNIFENREKDFWLDLPEKIKEGISKSIGQAERGELIEHKEVLKKYQNYL
jgi:predicted transcriptional regulator